MSFFQLRSPFYPHTIVMTPAGPQPLQTRTYTFTVDGIVKAVNTSTFTVDAIVKTVSTKTFTVDGVVKVTTTKTFTVDGIVKTTSNKTFTVDAILAARVNLAPNPSFEIDTAEWSLQAQHSRSTANSYRGTASLRFNSATPVNTAMISQPIYTIPGGTYILSAFLYKVAGYTGELTIDWIEFDIDDNLIADGSNTVTPTVTDQWVRVSTGPLTLDPSTVYVEIRLVTDGNAQGTAYVDGYLFEHVNSLKPYFDGTSTNAFWTDIAHDSPSYTFIDSNQSSFTVDGIIRETKTKTFTVDGIVKASTTFTFTVDGIVKESKTKTFTVDAIVLSATTKTFTVDGIVRETQTKTFTVDAVVRETLLKTFTVDAVVKAATLFTFTVDGIVLSVTTKTFTVDAVVLAQTTATFTVDGIVKAATNKTFTVDGIITAFGIATFTVDGIIKVTTTTTFTVDAVVKVATNATVTVDGIIIANKDYSREATFSLPTNDNNLATLYNNTETEVTVDTDNDVRVALGDRGLYQIHQFKRRNLNLNNTDPIVVIINMQATLIAPSTKPVYLQIYNRNSSTWETIAVNNTASAGVDFTFSKAVTTNVANYYDQYYIVSFRVYQDLSS